MAVARSTAMAATKFSAAALPPDLLKSSAPERTTSLHSLSRFAEGAELPLLDVNFCGECMPLDQADVADRWKHVFTLYRQQGSSHAALRQRADKFFPLIDPILEKYGIPSDCRFIPLAESGLNGRAVSRAGAAGYWQLMPQTARELGLVVNSKVDERFNVKKSTEAACRYLRRLYTQFGSWSLVAAAYNVGPGFMKTQLQRQAHRDYYRLRLPRETRFYLYRVLVYKEMLSRPDDYSTFLTPGVQTAFRPVFVSARAA